MVKSVLVGLFILVVAVFAYVGYSSYPIGKASASAEPYADGMVTARSRAMEARAEPAPATPASTQAAPAVTTPTNAATTASGNPAPNGQVAQGELTATPVEASSPGSDSIAPNPPNGMTFGGSGHFQLYRQGDLTWRLNTQTGETCVIFATNAEWRNPKVYKAGCKGK